MNDGDAEEADVVAGGSQDPLVTVVVTTHERPADAATAVSSALAQSHRGMEVLIVDDGVDPRYEPPEDPRVRLLRTAGHVGVNRARNAGLADARGSWIAFLDDDDVLLPDMVAASLGAAAASRLPPPVAVCGGLAEIAPDGAVVRTLLPRSSARGRDWHLDDVPADARLGMTAYNALLVPTAVLRSLGGFDEAFTAWMHTDLFVRLNRSASIEALPQVTYHMRHHQASRLSTRWSARADGMARAYALHRSAFARDRAVEVRHLSLTSWNYLKAGAWGLGIAYELRALARWPRRPHGLHKLALAVAGPWAVELRDRRRKLRGGMAEEPA